MKVEPGFLSESDHSAISLESLSSLTGLLDLNDRAEHRFFVGFSTFSSYINSVQRNKNISQEKACVCSLIIMSKSNLHTVLKTW